MNGSIRRIAHLSDVHLLAKRPSDASARPARLLSFGRRSDGAARIRKLSRALESARRGGADHFVLSGDLTDGGTPGQFEQLAETLHDTKIDPARITLVPGDHDARTHGGWDRALSGPLRAFAPASAGDAGKVVDRGDVCIMPLDVSSHQTLTRSAGVLTAHAAACLWRRLKDTALSRRVMVVVQHHPPFAHSRGPWQWVDGLRGTERQMALLASYPHAHVLHGHLHRVGDHPVGRAEGRIFGAPAVVEDKDGTPRVRMYDLRNGALESAGLSAA